jgi:uncharacterized protein (DUF433 family)
MRLDLLVILSISVLPRVGRGSSFFAPLDKMKQAADLLANTFFLEESMTTLDFEPLTVVVPLREEPPGVLRVGKSRVLLELVLRAFKAGATPESIVQSYDTLKLADVYAVVSRYLAAPEPFEEYLHQREESAAEMRRQIEEFQGTQGNLRATLLARAKAKEEARAQTGQR